MKISKNKQIMNFTMLGLYKTVKWQARTTLMSGNVHENCKVGKTSYRRMDLCSSKITETKRESGGTQRNLRSVSSLWVELLKLMLNLSFSSGVGLCVRFFFKLRYTTCEVPSLSMLKGAGLSGKHQTHRVMARTMQVGSTGHGLADTDWSDGTTRRALL